MMPIKILLGLMVDAQTTAVMEVDRLSDPKLKTSERRYASFAKTAVLKSEWLEDSLEKGNFVSLQRHDPDSPCIAFPLLDKQKKIVVVPTYTSEESKRPVWSAQRFAV